MYKNKKLSKYVYLLILCGIFIIAIIVFRLNKTFEGVTSNNDPGYTTCDKSNECLSMCCTKVRPGIKQCRNWTAGMKCRY